MTEQQPYQYRRREIVEPEWRRLPGYRDVTAQQWRDVRWQRRHSIKNLRELRDVLGDLVDERFYADARADQRRHATMAMLITPQVLNTMVPDAVPDTERFYADPVRRYIVPVGLRSPPRVARAPPRVARLAPRGGDVAGRGPDPPLPDQGARRAGLDLPAVLRALHSHGSCRPVHSGHGQVPLRHPRPRPPRGDARVPARHAHRARRRGQRRRPGQPSLAAPGGVPRRAARDRQRARHPPGQQGADVAAPALAGRRCAPRRGTRGHEGVRPWGRPGHAHPRQRGQPGHRRSSPRPPAR